MEAGFEEHPLCSDPEGSDEQDKEEAKESAPSPAPTRSTRSKTRAVDLEDESEGEGLSDPDEAMSCKKATRPTEMTPSSPDPQIYKNWFGWAKSTVVPRVGSLTTAGSRLRVSSAGKSWTASATLTKGSEPTITNVGLAPTPLLPCLAALPETDWRAVRTTLMRKSWASKPMRLKRWLASFIP
jgi:hypothetical protein